MGGVDRADHLSKYNTITRKSVKWWKKLAFHLLNFAITNAYILYRKYEHKPISQYKFREALVLHLTSQHQSKATHKGRKIVGNPSSRLLQRHFPSSIPPQEGAKKLNPTRACVVCNTPKGKRAEPGESRKRKETRYWCADCSVPLCIDPCFRRYHTLKHFKEN